MFTYTLSFQGIWEKKKTHVFVEESAKKKEKTVTFDKKNDKAKATQYAPGGSPEEVLCVCMLVIVAA